MEPMLSLVSRIRQSVVLLWAGLLGLLSFPAWLYAGGGVPGNPEADAWVEARLSSMSPAERIGQLFMIRVHSDGTAISLEEARRLAEAGAVGGVCFFQGSPQEQLRWTSTLQASAKTPLLVAMDAEWGVAMRFGDLVPRLPFALTVGAANDMALSRRCGREAGRQLRHLGVHMSFSPVADLNSEPLNPVIGRRSFGEDPARAGDMAVSYARGLADAGILAVAKHFPGHGNTRSDSHLSLPVLTDGAEYINNQLLVPFRRLAQDGVAGIMTGHLAVPAFDDRAHRPASLSAGITQGILRSRWNYRGLIITDALDMAAVTRHYTPGRAAVEAIRAGNDILLLTPDLSEATRAVEKALAEGSLRQSSIDASVRRILYAKYKAGLNQTQTLSPELIMPHLRSSASDNVSEQVYRKAITVLRTRTIKLPIVRVDSASTAVLSIGRPALSDFQVAAGRYIAASQLNISKPLEPLEIARWADQLSTYQQVIVGLHDMNWRSDRNYGLLPSHLEVLRRVKQKTNLLIVVFGSPYALSLLGDFDNLMVAYEDHPLAQKAAAESIFGAIYTEGILPVSVPGLFAVGSHQYLAPLFRLQYSQAQNAGFSESGLYQIDELVRQAISEHATPGAVFLAARKGQVGYFKAFGRHTYDSGSPLVDTRTVYDLASVTKVCATTLAIMRLHEQGALSIYDPIGKHLPALKGSDKEGLLIQDILAHQAGLHPWIPFFEATIGPAPDGKKAWKPGYYSAERTGGYGIAVTDRLYLLDSYRDSIYQQIIQSELRTQRGYKYSDLGFYLMAMLVQQKSGIPLDIYVERNFYRPLGLRSTGFNPLSRMSADRVAPTEEDNYFRFARVQGFVHDMGAAMLGGVSGHAGLFGEASDLAIIMQMLLNEGYYGGRRFFKPETVRLFTTRHPESTRRGIGWDMAELAGSRSSNISAFASAKTFGHLGFTGTCVWADPETGVIFICLTNRTYPSMSSNRWGRQNYRPKLQDAVYRAIPTAESN